MEILDIGSGFSGSEYQLKQVIDIMHLFILLCFSIMF